jgi:hypothetical protein
MLLDEWEVIDFVVFAVVSVVVLEEIVVALAISAVTPDSVRILGQ